MKYVLLAVFVCGLGVLPCPERQVKTKKLRLIQFCVMVVWYVQRYAGQRQYLRKVSHLSEVTNIIITGVGGQGILLASEIISEAAVHAGYDVKRSEIHGMAQRGGSVNSHIRFGKKIYSPLVMMGECDLLLSFEKL